MDHAYEQTAGTRWLDRLRWRIFPRPLRPRLEDDPRTFISTVVTVHVDWPDRLRLLFSGVALIQVTTYTDVLVNEAESVSVFSVEAR